MKLYKTTYLILLCSIVMLLPEEIFSQGMIKRTNNWFFGRKAGLDFNTSPPTVLINSSMNTPEGCASVSDTNGNLLFYTNGIVVYNKNHNSMHNGINLAAHPDVVQSCLIVPYPQNDTLFYIFTLYANGFGRGLCYSIVNMKENNGLGDVIVKNVLLNVYMTEKLTATTHANGTDVWVTAHELGNNCFISYLVTKNGIVDCPVRSCEGTKLDETSMYPTDAQGTLKYSPDGKTLANIVFWYNSEWLELFDFDNATGIIKYNSRTNSLFLPYGLEFSKNSKVLYVTQNNGKVTQFDVTAPVLKNSEKTVMNYGKNIAYAAQLAPDDKIYIAVYDSFFLGVINRPDSLGDSCLAVIDGFDLLPVRSLAGLPNFVCSYFYNTPVDYTYSTNCDNNTISFSEKVSIPVTQRSWKIYYGNHLLDSFTSSTFNYSFNDTGTYYVRLIINNSDTATKMIRNYPEPIAISDTLLCNADSLLIKIPDNYRCPDWNIGTDAMHYTIKQSGTYSVTVMNEKSCLVTDSIHVLFSNTPKPTIYFTGDTLFTDSVGAHYYVYRNGTLIQNSQDNKFAVSDTGSYSIYAENSNGCGRFSDTLVVKCAQNIPNIRLSEDTLFTDTLSWDYLWFHNDVPFSQHKSFVKISDTGAYHVQLISKLNCVTNSAKLKITCISGRPNIYKSGDSLLTDSIANSYIWYKDGIEIPFATSAKLLPQDTGAYTVTSVTYFGCKQTSVPFNIECTSYEPNIRFSGDTLYTDNAGYRYDWYLNNTFFTSTTQGKIRTPQVGNYQVVVFSDYGCQHWSMILEVSELSIDKNTFHQVKIYPNPVKDILTVESNLPINRIEVFDITGRKIEEITRADGSYKILVDLTALPEGIYFLKLDTTNIKIIKQP